jgi:hypothetical protein
VIVNLEGEERHALDTIWNCGAITEPTVALPTPHPATRTEERRSS